MNKANFFKKGYDPRRAQGGARPGAGRKPDKFKQWMKDLLHSKKARARFEKIIQDEKDAEDRINGVGEIVPARAKADTYLKAFEMGLHYVKGRPVQQIQSVDEEGNPTPIIFLSPQNKGDEGKVEK